MAVSGINSYTTSLYQWQGQKLASTGSNSSSASRTASSLFNNTSSMTDQVSSMVELTKYAMNAMGVDSNSHVTFTQITKYRNQLESEFNAGLKKGLAESGISDLNALTFSLNSSGKISVSGTNASDRSQAQAWLDANPAIGMELAASLKDKDVDIASGIDFRLSSSGKMTVIDNKTASMQKILNDKADLADALRGALAEEDLSSSLPLDLSFDDNGNLVVSADNANAEAINKILLENQDLAKSLKTSLEKNSIELSSVSLRLGKEGVPQITVHDMNIKEAQEVLDASSTTGSKMAAGLSDLGIDPNISFTIQIDENGSINVVSDHPDRDKMQRFFEENPELVKKYRQIETLAGIDDARKAMQLSPNTMRKRIQVESMAAWWASTDSSSTFGAYSSGSLSILSGLNLNV